MSYNIIFSLLLIMACGGEDVCGPHRTNYTHSVLYCEGEPPTVLVACDPLENIERLYCAPEEDLLEGKEQCKLVSICCTDYQCIRGE